MLELGGTITEPRFRDMTEIQWLFHYMMIQKQKKRDFQLRRSILKVVMENIQDIMLFVSSCIDAERTSKVVDEINKKKNGGTYKLTKREEEDLALMKASPEDVFISYEVQDPSELNTAPRVDRERFKKLAARLETYKTKDDMMNQKK